MKRLTTNNISSTRGFPPKAGTWEFLQDAYKELGAAAMIALIGESYDASKVYVLYGIVFTGVSWTNGAIFYNGEVYVVQAGTALGGGGTIVANLLVTQFTTNADPVTFTDSVAYNVHDIRSVVFFSGTSGTGTLTGDTNGDLGNILRVPPFLSSGITYGSVGGYSAANIGSPYYDIGYRVQGGMVHLCGAAALVVPAPGTFTIVTLPVLVRPAKTVVINPERSITSMSSPFTISAAGVLSFSASGASSGNVYLDGVSYRLS